MSKKYISTTWPKVIVNVENLLKERGWTKGRWDGYIKQRFWFLRTENVIWHLYITETSPYVGILSKLENEDRIESKGFYIQEFSFEQPSHHHYWPPSVNSDDEWEAAVMKYLTEIK